MPPELLQRADDLLHQALELPLDQQRDFVASRCGEEDSLYLEVCSLLDADTAVADQLEVPVFDLLSPSQTEDAVTIGPYETVRELGRGGGGVVYLAERADGEYRKQVAIKVLRRGPVSHRSLRRFRAERQILAHLEHPNIAKLFEGGTTADRRPYIVMEYVQGEPIDEYCRRRELSLRQRLELFVKVCDAVQHAHRSLVIHRDLKPSNILVDAAGEPKLLDFGIAKHLDPESSLATDSGLVPRPMTPQYASPEQVKGGSITTATDVYALGLVLYELLTGERALDLGEVSPQRAGEIICFDEPPLPSAAARRMRRRSPDAALPASQLAGDLDAIVMKALRKEPEHRYATVERLAADLSRHLEGRPVEARRGRLPYRLGKLVRRHARTFAAALVLAVILAGFLIEHERQRREARQAQRRAEAAATYLAEVFLFSRDAAEEARALIPKKVLDRGRRMLGDLSGQPELQCELMTAVGRGYLRLGHADEAAPLLLGALELRRSLGPGDVTATADRLYDVAWLRIEQGRYREAEDVYRRILELKSEALGPEHLETASVYNALAAAIMDQGRYEEAEPLFRRALEVKVRELGDGHPRVSAIAGNLAVTLYYRGHYEEAAEHFRSVLEATRLRLPERDDQVSSAKVNLAAALRSQGAFAAADALLEEVEEVFRARPKTLGLGRLLAHQATSALMQDEPDRALGLASESLAIVEELAGRDHPEMARAETLRARVLLALGRPGEAEPLLRHARKTYRGSQSSGHWRRAETESLLGACALALGRVDEAAPLLRASHRELVAEIGRLALPTQEAAARLAELDAATGATPGDLR